MDEPGEQLLRECAAAMLSDGATEGHGSRGLETECVFSAAMDSSIASIKQQDPASGELTASWTPSDATQELLRSLRRHMYEPGLGTWYWLSLRVGPAGELDSDFHYDERPEWDGMDLRVEPGAYRADLEEYPRNAEALPDWLSERIVESD